jgi:hypothetical protein
MQHNGYDATTFRGNDSSDGSREKSGERGSRPGSHKRLKPTPCSDRSLSSNKGDRSRDVIEEEEGEEDNNEYEVERILEVRSFRGALQYRAEWVGYEHDTNWYNASNFKSSPYRLRDFHTLNPTRPGPPERLDWWVQCWEKDIDADDHPRDNMPKQIIRRQQNTVRTASDIKKRG